jgi:hypothetical protein
MRINVGVAPAAVAPTATVRLLIVNDCGVTKYASLKFWLPVDIALDVATGRGILATADVTTSFAFEMVTALNLSS